MLKISYKNQRVSKQTEKDRCLDTMQWSSSSSFLCLIYTLYAASQVRSVVNDVPREAGTRPNWNEKTSSIKSSCIEETERREKSEFEIRKKNYIYISSMISLGQRENHTSKCKYAVVVQREGSRILKYLFFFARKEFLKIARPSQPANIEQ